MNDYFSFVRDEFTKFWALIMYICMDRQPARGLGQSGYFISVTRRTLLPKLLDEILL